VGKGGHMAFAKKGPDFNHLNQVDGGSPLADTGCRSNPRWGAKWWIGGAGAERGA